MAKLHLIKRYKQAKNEIFFKKHQNNYCFNLLLKLGSLKTH